MAFSQSEFRVVVQGEMLGKRAKTLSSESSPEMMAKTPASELIEAMPPLEALFGDFFKGVGAGR